MEAKINIAEILKDKPVNTKLYSPLYGDVYFSYIGVRNNIIVLHHLFTLSVFLYNGRYTAYKESEIMLFPSKDMRDWRKFAWKKGDVLVSIDGKCKVIFDKFNDDKYTSFIGKHYLESYGKDGELLDYEEEHYGDTVNYTKESEEAAQTYINTIEERLGGKLNRETLEIEKTQPEFKNGDIVFMKGIKSKLFANCIFILRSEYKDGDERVFYYAFYNADDKYTLDEYGNTKVHYSLRLATDSEKQQLFDALSKKGKRWDAEKKEIVDLKPKVELKPFDKVLVRDSKSDNWRANLFGYIDKDGYYRCVYANWVYCIPYAGNEHLLGTTNNVEG